MSFASDDLRHEHEGILAGLDILGKMVGRLKRQDLSAVPDLKEMIGFFRLFADQCHHGKEENLYFPVLEEFGIQNKNGPIGQMLLEHAEGRKLINSMSAALEGPFQSSVFIEAADRYVALLRAHIGKENNILFPLGDQQVPSARQNELLERFERFEEEVMGQGTHERLHALLDRFEEKYN